VAAWRVALEASGLGAISINGRPVRKLADNGRLAPELSNGIARVKGVASKGVRRGNCPYLPVRPTAAERGGRDHKHGACGTGSPLAVLLGCGLRRSEVAAPVFPWD